MARVCMLLAMLCLASQVIADTGRAGQRAELQVGGPLRIKKVGTASDVTGSERSIEEARMIAPSHGIWLSLTGTLNNDSQVVAERNPDRRYDPRLAYALTRSMSVGIGYDFIEAEDLATDGDVEGMIDIDHQSHHLLLRALWHFE